MPPRLTVVSLWAEDVPATAHFYRDVVGLPLLAHHRGDRPHFDLGGGAFLTILKGKPQPALDPQPERFPLLALRVDDLDAMAARLQAHGVALPWGIEQDSNSRWVMFYDPAGNLVEVVAFG